MPPSPKPLVGVFLEFTCPSPCRNTVVNSLQTWDIKPSWGHSLAVLNLPKSHKSMKWNLTNSWEQGSRMHCTLNKHLQSTHFQGLTSRSGSPGGCRSWAAGRPWSPPSVSSAPQLPSAYWPAQSQTVPSMPGPARQPNMKEESHNVRWFLDQDEGDPPFPFLIDFVKAIW